MSVGRQVTGKLPTGKVGLYPTLCFSSWAVEGAQLLSGRVLDSRPRGRGFEPHRHHCVVSLSKTNLFLLSTGSIQEDPS